MNILIVEDEWINAEFIKSVLYPYSKNIFSCEESSEAINIVKSNHIDIAFMDINIKGNIDGIKCASMINEIYPICIIYTTAYCDDETIKEASLTNAYGYLIKPFDENDIKAIFNIVKNKISLKEEKTNNNLKISNYSYNKEKKTLYFKDEVIILTKRENTLLHELILNLNQTITYEILKQNVWENSNIANSTLRDVILRLRKKAPYLDIENINSIGYILKN